MPEAFKNIIENIESYAHQDRHKYQSIMSALRLLQGAVIAGRIKVDDGKKIMYDLVKNIYVPANKTVDQVIIIPDNFFQEVSNKQNAINKSIDRKYSKPFNIGDRKVLIVDNNVKSEGWEQIFSYLFDGKIICAETAEAAINQLGIYDNKLLCVLVDLKLKESFEDGIKLISKISEIDRSLPIIVFSASDSVIYLKKSFQNGAWDYFTKSPSYESYRTAYNYFTNFCDILFPIINYDKEYRSKYWFQIRNIELNVKSKSGEHFNALWQRIVFHLQKAFIFLVTKEMDRYSLSFIKTSHAEESILQSAFTLEVYCTIVLSEKRIFRQKLRRSSSESGEWRLTLESTLEPGATLGQKLELLKVNRSKTALTSQWFEIAFELNELRGKVVHSTEIQEVGGKRKIKASSPVQLGDAIKALENVIKLISVSA